MLNTIEACNEALSKVDLELERLNLERKHILAVRELLGKKKGTMISRRIVKQRLREIVAENPGIDGITIREILDDNSLTPRQVTFIMSDMRRKGEIVNRGSHARGARWYVEETS